jgi:2-polyprenyl-3-methyl-5-hydroxy-6-metoxy-1,4-benzoquinol methylase
MEVIEPLVRGKSVLDCGPGGEEIAPEETWWTTIFLHAHIAKAADECIGVDLDEAAVEQLCAMGYNLQVGNIETLDLGRTFDVVVAGELIEHLSNPGLFLDMAKRHLEPGGKLILSTPNAWALGNLVRSLFGRKIVINKGHIAWYDRVILEQLLSRHGFEIEEFYWQQRVFRRATHLVKIFPHWALNFIVIAKRKNNP